MDERQLSPNVYETSTIRVQVWRSFVERKPLIWTGATHLPSAECAQFWDRGGGSGSGAYERSVKAKTR